MGTGIVICGLNGAGKSTLGKALAEKLDFYFIDNEDYFQRKFTTEDENGNSFDDNDERSIFFVRGVMETVKKLRWVPDIIHCHGWMTALAPLYIKKAYAEDPCFRDIYSSYNNSFNSPFPASFSDKLLLEGIRKEDLNFTDKPIDFSELTKLAIRFSDGVIQASETMQPDILEYTKNAGIPFLPYQDPENYIDAYNEFYDVVWENAHK